MTSRGVALLSCLSAVLGHAALLYGVTAAAPHSWGADGRTVPGTREAVRARLVAAPIAVEQASRTYDSVTAHRGLQRAAVVPIPAEPTHGDGGRHFAASEVDRPALPRSAPDTSMLDGAAPSGLPIRLRLYIAASGEVTQVEALQASADDAPTIERLRAMFTATAFIAAKRRGIEVPSYMDIDIDFTDVASAGLRS